MPNQQALEVFCGTIPLVLVLLGLGMRKQKAPEGHSGGLGCIETQLASVSKLVNIGSSMGENLP